MAYGLANDIWQMEMAFWRDLECIWNVMWNGIWKWHVEWHMKWHLEWHVEWHMNGICKWHMEWHVEWHMEWHMDTKRASFISFCSSQYCPLRIVVLLKKCTVSSFWKVLNVYLERGKWSGNFQAAVSGARKGAHCGCSWDRRFREPASCKTQGSGSYFRDWKFAD